MLDDDVRRVGLPDYEAIYRTQAHQYDLLIAREDYQGNLPLALRQLRSWDGTQVIELGAGTGRLTLILAPLVETIWLFDISCHMLDNARAKLSNAGLDNWAATVADNRRLPVANGIADVCIAGWSLGHFTSWHPTTWRGEIKQTLAQIKRALRPGGMVILLETLGTGQELPHPPSEGLALYYQLLEKEHGFASTWIRTDYRFRSLNEAQELTRFFFGDELADRAGREELIVLPECTGIWWLSL